MATDDDSRPGSGIARQGGGTAEGRGASEGDARSVCSVAGRRPRAGRLLLVPLVVMVCPALLAADASTGAVAYSGVVARAGVEAPVSAGSWAWPLQPPRVLEAFAPPTEQYGAGHRGIDLDGDVGQSVAAVDDGVVVFAGTLAGRGVVSVQHDNGLRSTYEPVTSRVRPGDSVRRGEPVGTLALPGSHCLPDACLHLGARTGEDSYVDPLDLLGGGPIRLKPWSGGPPTDHRDPALSNPDPLLRATGAIRLADVWLGLQARGWA